MFIEELFRNPAFYFSWVLVVMFSVTLHEYAHARAAYGAGDDTAWLLGHCSLNPWVQMGPSSLAILAVFGVAWGAVPISQSQLRDPRARAWVSFAGPLTNLLLALMFSGVSAVFQTWWLHGANSPAAQFMHVGGAANAMLFVLNLLPIPMLDGWEISSLFFPAMRRITAARAQQVSWIAVLLVFISPLGGAIWGAAALLHTLLTDLWLRAFAVF
jgi:Zn-dependent protease